METEGGRKEGNVNVNHKKVNHKDEKKSEQWLSLGWGLGVVGDRSVGW